MNILVVLNAVSVTSLAFEKVFDGLSAFERALLWAQSVPGARRIDVFTSALSANLAPENFALQSKGVELVTVFEEEWTVSSLLKNIANRAETFDAVVFGWADCPFYDHALTEQLLSTHKRYGAEYTFADGYPSGLTPEIIHPASAAILAELAKDDYGALTRDVFFSVLKKDINAFEIETIIAPKDLRYLRLDCFCATKRDMLLCARIFAVCAADCTASVICAAAEKSPEVQRTLPAFYALQIAAPCKALCTFCPYPAQFQAKYAKSPAQGGFMELDKFRLLVKKIADFSHDAVISFSLWGDPLTHPQFAEFTQTVLEFPALSLLIETDASLLTPELAQKTAEIAQKSPRRTNGQKPVNWIIGIDAFSAELYKKQHGFNGFETANEAVKMLRPLFPQAVYPQFVRLAENESQLEDFYRYWKEQGHVIIQKYDWFSGLLEDKKVADLTPVARNPCWHLRRDLCVLADGGVPLCRSGFFNPAMGNVFDEPLEAIWARGVDLYKEQLQGRYAGICEKCDEYYTFNF